MADVILFRQVEVEETDPWGGVTYDYEYEPVVLTELAKALAEARDRAPRRSGTASHLDRIISAAEKAGLIPTEEN